MNHEKPRRRRRAIVLGVATPALLVANLAHAAWNTGGTGTGSADAGAAQNLTIAAADVVASADVLYPTTSGNVRLVVTNPNPYNVDLASASFGAITTSSAACVVHGVTFDDVADLGLVVGANASLAIELVDHAHMSNDAENGCQGVTFTAPVTIVGASTAAAASPDQF